MTQSIRVTAILPLLLIISLLTACGFHLRGNLDIASDVSRIAVVGSDRTYIRDLTRALENSGIQVTEMAPLRLKVMDIMQETSGQNRSATGNYENKLMLQVVYQLETSDGLLLFSPVKMNVERYISQNQNQANAAQSEIDLTFRELRQEIINRTVRQVAGISGTVLESEVNRAREAHRRELERKAEAAADR